MQRAIALLTVVAVLMFAGAVWADDMTPESADFFGHAYVNGADGVTTWAAPPVTPTFGTNVYSNVLSPANFGFSSTSLVAKWGDRLLMTGAGILSENDFTIFNSGSSGGGALLTATVSVGFYDYATTTFLGAYSTSINFGGGLPTGSYSIVTVTGLDPLLINLSTSDILIIQTVTAKTGTANRLGIASLDPPTIGSSPNTMYIDAATVGPAGFYNIGNPPSNANPGYRVNANLPVPTESKTWGGIKALYR